MTVTFLKMFVFDKKCIFIHSLRLIKTHFLTLRHPRPPRPRPPTPLRFPRAGNEGPNRRSRADREKLISAPMNFNHITHFGPGEGLQMLTEIPETTATTAAPSVGAAPTGGGRKLISGPTNLSHISHMGPGERNGGARGD